MTSAISPNEVIQVETSMFIATHDGICDIHSVTIFHIFGGFDTWMPQDDDAQLELSRAEKS